MLSLWGSFFHGRTFTACLCVTLQVAREAHFSGQSYLGMTVSNIPTLSNNFYTSFSFRTEHKEGLMFYHRDQVGPTSCFDLKHRWSSKRPIWTMFSCVCRTGHVRYFCMTVTLWFELWTERLRHRRRTTMTTATTFPSTTTSTGTIWSSVKAARSVCVVVLLRACRWSHSGCVCTWTTCWRNQRRSAAGAVDQRPYGETPSWEGCLTRALVTWLAVSAMFSSRGEVNIKTDVIQPRNTTSVTLWKTIWAKILTCEFWETLWSQISNLLLCLFLCSSGKRALRWFWTWWRQKKMSTFLWTVLLPKNLNRSSVLSPKTTNTRYCLLTHQQSSVDTHSNLIVCLTNTHQGKNKKPSGSRSRNTRDSCHGKLSHKEVRATHFSGSTNSYERYDAPPTSMWVSTRISFSRII